MPDTPKKADRQLEASLKEFSSVQLILDIFAIRAQSRGETLGGSSPVFNYLLPRLYGQVAFDKGGGIGTGPGENQLEVISRHIRSVIHHAKEELADIAAHRERTRSRQLSGHWQVSLVDYTNAGKSTLAVDPVRDFMSDQLFTALDPLTRMP